MPLFKRTFVRVYEFPKIVYQGGVKKLFFCRYSEGLFLKGLLSGNDPQMNSGSFFEEIVLYRGTPKRCFVGIVGGIPSIILRVILQNNFSSRGCNKAQNSVRIVKGYIQLNTHHQVHSCTTSRKGAAAETFRKGAAIHDSL